MSIRCAACGQTIDIGCPVRVFIPRPEFEVPDYAVRINSPREERPHLVGCQRANCSDSGANIAGFWLPPGQVEHHHT